MFGRRFWEIGGFIAGAVLILFGAAAIYMGVDGRNTVRDSLKDEQVFFSTAEDEDAATDKYASEWYGEQVTTGDQARAFASIMREHQLERTEGLTYAQMGRFMAAANPDDREGDERRGGRAQGRGGQSDLQPRPAELGDGGRHHDGAQHELHGRAALDLRHGRRRGAAPHRRRPRDPRLRGVRTRAGGRDRQGAGVGTAGNELIRGSTGGTPDRTVAPPPGAHERAAQPPSRAFGSSPQVESAASRMLASPPRATMKPSERRTR